MTMAGGVKFGGIQSERRSKSIIEGAPWLGGAPRFAPPSHTLSAFVQVKNGDELTWREKGVCPSQPFGIMVGLGLIAIASESAYEADWQPRLQ
jgi:hypothetical protein